jgi:hypothetical protein
LLSRSGTGTGVAPAKDVIDSYGIRVEHLVARPGEREDREEHDRLRPGRDHHPVGRDPQPPGPLEERGDALA